MRTARRRSRYRLSAPITLHLVQFAHQLRAPGKGIAHHQAFADKACPKEGDRQRDRR
jgi:hypothetical protein